METVNADFHRYAVLVAISTIILIAIGAAITSQASGRQLASRGVLNAFIHRDAAMAVIVLAVGLAIWLSLAQEGPFLGWIAASFIVLDGWAGWRGQPVLHASIAPLAFGLLTAIAVLTSSRWSNTPEIVEVGAARLLRPLAIAAPPLVLLQTVLGAAYRHKLTGVVPHLAGAMLVSIATLVAATLVMQHFPTHRGLRSAASWLIAVVITQVILGATAFAMELLDVASPVAVIVATASHVVFGSLTLAASLVLAMQVQRSVRHTSVSKTTEMSRS